MTINEIAKLAGVSISTVSKIMNHKDHNISPETREKVLSVVKEYNYSPYAFARESSISKSFLLGILLRNGNSLGHFLDGVMAKAQECGYRIIVCDSQGREDTELKHITALCKVKADGVIWEPVSSESAKRKKYFEEINCCITWLNCDQPNACRVDYGAIVQQAADYFIAERHKKFSLLTDPSSSTYSQVLNGYKTALFEHDMTFDQDALLSYNKEEWMMQIKSLGLTGIISTNYSQTLQLYKLLKQYLYDIPFDFSIITLAEDTIEEISFPEISSMRIPYHEFGQYVCKRLLSQCEQHSEDQELFSPTIELSGYATLDCPASVKPPRIIVVGSINIDTSLNVHSFPGLGQTVTTSKYTISPGGKGINQAVGVAKLNHKAILLGNVGNDLESGLIYSCLKEYKIDNSGIHKDKLANTGKAYIQVQDNGESSITILTGANTTITASNIRENSRLFHNCAYCLMQTEISMEAIEEAASIAREYNVKTILKPSAVSTLSDTLLKNIDILVPNQKEAASLCKLPLAKDANELAFQADTLLEKGVGTVIITLGKDGCFLKTGDYSRLFAAAEFVPMDVTGGSDAFISALASYLLRGYDLDSAIRIANYAAGFCISRRGIVPALIDQVSLEKYIRHVSPGLIQNVPGQEIDL